jgi:hypothetical protein
MQGPARGLHPANQQQGAADIALILVNLGETDLRPQDMGRGPDGVLQTGEVLARSRADRRQAAEPALPQIKSAPGCAPVEVIGGVPQLSRLELSIVLRDNLLIHVTRKPEPAGDERVE